MKTPTFSAVALGVALLSAAGANAQAPGRVGTIVVAHGADSIWNGRVLDVARQARTGGPIEVSFLMGPSAARTRFQDAVRKLESEGVTSIVVVPMLVSSHSGHYDQIRYLAGDSVKLDETMVHHLHMAGIERPTTRTPITLTPAMDDADEVAQVLAERANALAKNPSTRALLIVGHGPNSAEDHAQWMKNLRVVAETVKRLSGFRDVRVDLVRDDAPAPVRAEAVTRVRELIALQHMATGDSVIVVPVLVSAGAVSRDKLPNDIKDLPTIYAGETLLPHSAMARWIERRVRDAEARR